jgi:hypothetical protein
VRPSAEVLLACAGAPAARSRRAPAHRIGTSRRIFDSIGSNAVQLALWQRALPDGLGAALADWVRRAPAAFAGTCRGERVDVEQCLAGFEDEPWRGWLLDDIESLVREVSHRARTSTCRVSFGAVRSDQCRKFHVDYLHQRLISTYVGPGTEWVVAGEVRRDALSLPTFDPEEANRAIVRRQTGVRRARAGDVLLMKGRLGGGEGLVHRSPPIEALGIVRVVLVVSA